MAALPEIVTAIIVGALALALSVLHLREEKLKSS